MSVNDPYKTPVASLEERTESLDDRVRLDKMASGQKLVIYAVLIYFIAAASRVVIGPLVFIPLIASLIMSLVGLFKVLSARDSHIAIKVALFALLFVPLINILVLLRVNSHATKTLRAAGYRVGFMGAVKQEAGA